MKRFKAWLMSTRFAGWVKKHQPYSIVGLITLFFIGLIWIGSTIPESAPEKTPVEQQAQIAAASVVQPVDSKPTEWEAKRGYLEVDSVPSTAMIEALKAGEVVDAVVLNPNTMLVAASISDRGGVPKMLVARILPEQVPTILDTLGDRNIDVNVSSASVTAAKQASSSGEGEGKRSLWKTLLFVFFIFMVLLFFIRWASRVQERNSTRPMKEMGKTAADKEVTNVPTTRFADVAGCDEAIEEMAEMVEFFKNPERFKRTGAKPSRGALLVGPPGTGKTLLARAVAGEAGVPFFSVAGSDFVEVYVGMGAKRVRELFAAARKHEDGAIIFIDEIDAVGRARSSNVETGSSQETENTLNALLVEMDGFAASKIIVMGATNRDDLLDNALTRPGRLDHKVQVPLPDRAGRERILAVHAGDKPLSEDVDLNLIARRTPGMSGAELAQLVNEACMMAARADRDHVNAVDFDAAVATVAMGKARTSAVVTEHDRLVTAWHEAGHTVSALVLPDADPPVSVSIIPRGPAGGITWMATGDDLFLTRKRAFARLVVAMSGRAAEELLLDGEFTSGPHGDLQAATQTAMAMVTQYGMTEAGLMTRSEGLLRTGANLTDETVVAVERLLSQALDLARQTLWNHRALLEAVVDGLLENDTLVQAQLDALHAGAKIVPPVLLPPAPRDYHRPEPVAPTPAPPPVADDRYQFPPEEDDTLVGNLLEVWRRRKRRNKKTYGYGRIGTPPHGR